MGKDKLFDLSGKVALVTGGGSGIGLHLAKSMAEYGADVAIWGRTMEKLNAAKSEIEATGRHVMAQSVDVTDTASLDQKVEEIIRQFGHIDILVNSAGVNIPQWAEDVTEAAWDSVMDTNLKGTFFCCQAVGKVMIRQKRGKIINISSQAGSVGLIKRAAYCSSKGAVNQLTRVLAVEWAKHNITVNAIAPTFIETPMTRPMLEDKEFSDYVFGNILMDRLAKPEDLTGGMIYLASGASDMVTGHILHIDGGWTVH